MGLLERFGLWMAGYRAPYSKVLTQDDVFGKQAYAGIARTGRPPIRGTAELLDGYSNMPRLRSVIDRIAHSTAATPWRAHRIGAPAKGEKIYAEMDRKQRSRAVRAELRFAKSKSHAYYETVKKRLSDHGVLHPLPGHDALDLLNTPNPMLTASQVRQMIQIHLDLVGESFIVVARGKTTKKPRELWPMPPSWVRSLPKVDDPTYDIRTPNGYNGGKVPDADVIWMRYPNPANPYGRGSGIAASLNNELDADEYAARLTATRFWNNATPDLIIGVEGATDDQTKVLKRNWLNEHAGYLRSGQPHFTNAKIDVKQLSSTFADLTLVDLRQFEWDIIRQTFGVPPEVAGDTKNSNKATSAMAQMLFARYVLVPRLDLLEDYYDNHFMQRFYPEDADDVVLLYENPVPDDYEAEEKAAVTAPWAISIDEWRERMGEAPLPNGQGGQHVMPMGVQLVDLGGSESDLVETDDSEGERETDKPDSTDATSPEDLLESGGSGGESSRPPRPATDAGDTTSPYIGANAVVSIRKERAKRDPRIRSVINAIEPEDLFRDASSLWHDELRGVISAEALENGGDPAQETINGLVDRHIRELGGERIGGINDTTRDDVADALAEGLDEGDNMRGLIARVREAFADATAARAETIARTETGRSSNFGIHAGQKLAGIKKREWIGIQDDVQRDTHAELTGTIVGIDEPFVINGEEGMYPGDFDDPAEVVNCRCVTAGVLEDEEEERSAKRLRRANKRTKWDAFEKRRLAFEHKAMAAFRAGLSRQENKAIAAIRRAFGRKSKGTA